MALVAGVRDRGETAVLMQRLEQSWLDSKLPLRILMKQSLHTELFPLLVYTLFYPLEPC